MPGASAIAPAKDAAMARRSVSVNGPGGDGGGDAAILGGVPARGISGNEKTGISSDSAAGGAGELPPSPRSFGIARKNSFASLSITAGSGRGIAANGYLGKFSPEAGIGALDLDPFWRAPLLVLVILVDMDIL